MADSTTFKPGTRFECLACGNHLAIHSQYPAQPAAERAIELWCPACKTISIYNYTTPVVLLRREAK